MKRSFLTLPGILLISLLSAQPTAGLRNIDWVIYPNGTQDQASRLMETTIYYFNPPDSPVYYLQVIMNEQLSSTTYWAGRNIPLIPFADTVELSFTVVADSLNYHDSVPLAAQICGFAYASQWSTSKPALPYQFQTLPVNPAPVRVGNQLEQTPGGIDLNGLPTGPAKPAEFTVNDTVKFYFRGCRVPNHDLDDATYGDLGTPTDPNYAGDKNACGPVSCANSFMWLTTQHPQIQQKLDSAEFKGDTLARKLIEEFSRLMQRSPHGLVTIDKFIAGKLAFIDKYKLPVHVKYQSIVDSVSNRSTIPSPNTTYTHSAENKNLPLDTNKRYKRISWDFIKGEMERGEDVEAFFLWQKPNSTNPPFGHYVTLTGYMQQGAKAKRISFKDDWKQDGPGGTRHRMVVLQEDSNGMFCIPELTDSILGKCYLRDVVSESYDPGIVFNVTGLNNLTGQITEITLIGNPVTDQSYLFIMGAGENELELKMFLSDGRLGGQQKVAIASASEILSLQQLCENLSTGFYLLQVQQGPQILKTLKIFIRK